MGSCPRRRRGAITLGLALLAAGPARADLSRNAAGPQAMGEAGKLTVDSAGELEQENGASTWTLEAGLQYELSARFQLLAEMVFYERQELEAGGAASGMGDAELTLSWLALAGGDRLPPLVLAAKVKLPTAKAGEIGTGKADCSALAVLAKEYGELELALELEYATFGSPAGATLEEQVLYTAAADFSVNDYLSLYGELFGNSPPSAGESRTDAALAGLELEWPLSEAAAPYLSLELDTEGVGRVRAGIEWSW